MTGVTLDGDSLPGANASGGAGSSRSVSFEGLSLAGIDSIEISKTTSADVDADSPAGTINIRTKRAFDRRGRSIVVQVSGSSHENLWNGTKSRPGRSVRGRKKLLPNGEINYSDVFLDSRLGVMARVAKHDPTTNRDNIIASSTKQQNH